jgi:glutaredoxin
MSHTETDNALKVYGARWCPDVIMALRYLDRHGVDYRYCDIDKDPEAKAALLRISGDDWLIPTFVFPDDTVMVNPSIRDVADKLGRPPREE